MAEMKTIETNSSVDGFIDTIEDESKRQDCRERCAGHVVARLNELRRYPH